MRPFTAVARLSWLIPCYFLGSTVSNQKMVGSSTCSSCGRALALPFPVESYCLWKAFLSESNSRGVGESLPWLSITCWPKGSGSALWCRSGARTPLLWLLNLGSHFTPAPVASSLTFPEIAINVLGVSVKSQLHRINDSHSALVLVG